uniref:Uncharacterized protein n=2 Tax=unclassified Caudoviricetes TaxID=2788787 RepID=A0A8S5M0V7_9CAUD|nr:MAG TPA: hypothetical protein [Myoviridae sp. ctyFl19]DAE06171.1 MAG TPA: hypothetical protein [Myoviridae sp. ctdSc46]
MAPSSRECRTVCRISPFLVRLTSFGCRASAQSEGVG